jgi:hypothetical protein
MTWFREMELGKGTLGYKGETQEYYDSKRGLWTWTRMAIVAVLLGIGVMFALGSFSTTSTGTVTAVNAEGSQITVTTPDGRTGTIGVPTGTAPAVGTSEVVSILPWGRMVGGDITEQARWTGGAFILAGLVVAGWGVYRTATGYVAPTTVIAPELHGAGDRR